MSRIALVLMLLLTSLAAAQAAAASTGSLPLVPLAVVGEEGEEPDDGGDPEEADDGCDEESEECEEAETEELEETDPVPPEECLLRTARAHAVARGEKLKVTIGYATHEPVKATIRIKSGGTWLGSFQRRLRRSGVLRFTESLPDGRGPKPVVVRIRLATGNAGCPAGRLVLRG